ncbi:MAG: TonB-dependent receptor [Tannerella sp.]|jgi:TonB-linked SusC/RagA family outer membrane protein|nr:TonB-dependent receptor [Tannerella sp.]
MKIGIKHLPLPPLRQLLVLMCVFGLSFGTDLYGQTRKVTGTVSDDGGETLPGVSIMVKGTTQGITTDINGHYSINVSSDEDILVFSYLGFSKREIKIGNQQNLNVTLSESITEIEEVVVVGYGVQKKESSVAAISQVKGDDMLKMVTTNVANALSGQIAGVSVVQSSGKPGEDAGDIYIRGRSSWESSAPLVMVDGVERNFNNIDPNEIETLSVLKDASATAIFGVRGANGVILITTKRGTKGGVKVNATAETIAKQSINIIAPMNSYATALVMNEAYKNDNNWGSLLSNSTMEHYRTQDMPYVYPSTNWQELMLKETAFSQQYNVNISGGTDYARIFASVSYLYDGDIIKTEKQPTYNPTYEFDRYNYRFNIDADLTKTTLLSLDAGGFVSITNSPYETNLQRVYRPIYMLGPMVAPAEYPAEVLIDYPDPTRPDETGRRIAGTGNVNSENPMIGNNYSGQRTIKKTDLNATLRLKQDLNFITQGLSLNAKVAYTHNMAYVRAWSYDAISYHLNPDGSWVRYKGRGGNIDGEAPATPVNAEGESVSGDPFRSWYFEASVNYARNFGKHAVSGLILGQRRKNQTNVAFPRFEEGIIGRATYDYDTRYLFEVNMAYNGSEQFAPQNRYGFFPSYAVGWNLHNEKFFNPLKPIVSRAKIRASYGEVGSDASSNRWLYTSSYVNGAAVYGSDKYWAGTPTATGPSITAIVEEAAANANAKWERAVKQDIGVELAFLKSNMFVLTVDFFKEHRDQILLSRLSVPAWFGVGSKQQNLGETETKGYEVELKFQQTVANEFYYWLKPSVSFSDNRIISRDEPMYKPEYQKQEGHRIGTLFGYVSRGMIQNVDEQMNSISYGGALMGLGDSQWVDFNGDGLIDENDQVPLGYSAQYPLYNYGLGGGFRFRNFEFDFLLQGVSHFSKFVIDAYAWPLHRLGNHVFEYQLDTWSPDNRNAQFPAYHFDANRTHNNVGDGAVRTTNLYDGSYIRLKSLSLGYNLPKETVSKLKLEKLSVYLRGNNIFTWASDYPLADPEASDVGNDGRLVNGYYPMLKRISFGLQIGF